MADQKCDLSKEQRITILKIENAEYIGDTEKDSPIAYWRCNITWLSFKSINITHIREGQIFIKNFSAKDFKIGTYLIDLQNFKNGLPLFKTATE
jgi:hypothetical protein